VSGIRFANRESQHNMPAAGGDNFTDEFAQPSLPANNNCGNVIKPWPQCWPDLPELSVQAVRSRHQKEASFEK
jgi:hypothetical protein